MTKKRPASNTTQRGGAYGPAQYHTPPYEDRSGQITSVLYITFKQDMTTGSTLRIGLTEVVLVRTITPVPSRT